MNEILSIRGAARRLGKSHSTISRYVAGCPELNHGTAERPLVNVEELRQHRLENLNPSRIGSHAGRLLGEGDGAANGHADIPLAAEYDRAYNAGKELQQFLVDLAALLGERLGTMVDAPQIVTMLESEYGRILAALTTSLRADTEPAPLPEGEL